MVIAAWVVQGILAVAMGMAGFMKAARPKDELKGQMGWVEDFSQGFIRLIGAAEMLGALGLILPAATGVAPMLTPVAALGLILIQLGAVWTHARRGETTMLPINAVLIILAAFIAYTRFVVIGVA